MWRGSGDDAVGGLNDVVSDLLPQVRLDEMDHVFSRYLEQKLIVEQRLYGSYEVVQEGCGAGPCRCNTVQPWLLVYF